MTYLRYLVPLLLLNPTAAAYSREQPVEEISGPYRLGAGDEIRIAIFGLDAANSSYAIGDQGSISVPLVGQVDVNGKTLAEVEAALASTLRDKQILKEPSVSVQVVKYRPFFILGEVQKPGQYPYVPGMTVLNAVSIAGGYTFRANERKASISRVRSGVSSKATAQQDSRVMPGDTIIIPESWF